MDSTEYSRLKNLADTGIKDHTRAREAYEALYPVWMQGNLPARLNNSFAWVIYYHIRHEQATMPSQEMRKALAAYLSLDNERPSRLHSRILLMATRLKARDSEFKFAKFLDMWGMDNLTEEDWQQDRREGKEGAVTFISVAEHAIRLYAKELHDARTRDIHPAFEPLLIRAIKQYPTQSLYKYYLARLYAATGRKAMAIKAYKKLALISGQSYIWSDLASLLTDPAQRQAALCKALLLQRDVNKSGRLHLGLAQLLIKQERYPEAACELRQYRDIYTRNGWHLSDFYQRLRHSVPADTRPVQDNRALYQSSLSVLDDFMYSDLPEVHLTLTTEFKDKRGRMSARLVTEQGKALFIPASRLLHGSDGNRIQHYMARISGLEDRPKVVTLRAME
ncbi:MAG: hypothetical protein IJV05_09410 [Muribaculaceae bacterium]|nr:hypothetical protein [Muribaculaceae bacterium]